MLVVATARAAGGRHIDFREHAQKEDRLDQDDDGDRAGDMRQNDIAEVGNRPRAVERGGLLLLLVERLQRGQEDETRERQPFP